jgi:hypothetical protein
MSADAPRAAPSTALWRSGRVLLAVGVVLALSPLSERLPREQALRLELPPSLREEAHRMAVTWTRQGDVEPAGGFTVTLPPHSPASVRHELSVPNGAYQLDIEVEGGDVQAGAHTELRRNVTLTGGEVRVLLENTEQ